MLLPVLSSYCVRTGHFRHDYSNDANRPHVARFVRAAVASGGYSWIQADRVTTERAAWLSDPVSEDSAVTVAYSAAGFLNRDVRIVAFDFGVEDKVIEDAYADQILNGDEAEEFYHVGFRYVVSGNTSYPINSPSAKRINLGFKAQPQTQPRG